MKNTTKGALIALGALAVPFAANAEDCTRLRYPTVAPEAHRVLDPTNPGPVLQALSDEAAPLPMFVAQPRAYRIEAHPECPGVTRAVISIRRSQLDPREYGVDRSAMIVLNPEGATLPPVPLPILVRPINADWNFDGGLSRVELRVNVPRGHDPQAYLRGVAIRMTN